VLDLIEDFVEDNDEELLDWISKFSESNTSPEPCIRLYVILWCYLSDFREYMVFFLLDLATGRWLQRSASPEKEGNRALFTVRWCTGLSDAPTDRRQPKPSKWNSNGS
jgi:hypothetical protein